MEVRHRAFNFDSSSEAVQIRKVAFRLRHEVSEDLMLVSGEI